MWCFFVNNCILTVEFAVIVDLSLQTYNPTLELFAQNWSDGCAFKHGQGINGSTLSELGMGQNLYLTSSLTPINLTSSVVSWYNEIAEYTYIANTCAADAVCGHYTQVLCDSDMNRSSPAFRNIM